MGRLLLAIALVVTLVAVGAFVLSRKGRVDEIAAQGTPAEVEPADFDTTHDWPWWRGPKQNGLSSEESPATQWSGSENVVWKTKLPGEGHGSPIVIGSRIFLAAADQRSGQGLHLLVCLKRTTGEILWQREVAVGEFVAKHEKNSHASVTPASDGKRVFLPMAIDDQIRVAAYDFEGHRLWMTTCGGYASQHGYGASPTLWKHLVIVAGESLNKSFLVALHRDSGEIIWRIARGNDGSYSTPIVATVAGRDQLLISGNGQTCGYDPATGELLWYVDGPAKTTAATMTYLDDLVFSHGGYPTQNILAIRADGSGNVTDSHIVWKSSQNVPYVPSSLAVDGKLIVLADNRRLRVFDAKTGDTLTQARVGTGPDFTASVVKSGDYYFASDESGKTFVFTLGPQYDEVAVNNLGEPLFATPVILDGQIYLRSPGTLYCIGESAEPSSQP
jgi:outer membrane protein assembly factor BamB